MTEKEKDHTILELDDQIKTLEEIDFFNQEEMRKKHHYERESPYFKDNWKRVKNILRKYNAKLVHYGMLHEAYGKYFNKHDIIQVRPPLMFEKYTTIIHEKCGYCQFGGTIDYYNTICHELCHLILHREFNTMLLLDSDIEEIIVETVKQRVMLRDICPHTTLGDYAYDKLVNDSNEYIHLRKIKIIDNAGYDFWQESDREKLYNFIDEVEKKVRDVWGMAAVSGKKTFTVEFGSSLNRLEL